jgi:O-antigen/teichoic acid export membrane protein
MIKQLVRLLFASGSLLAAKSALLGMRVVALLLIGIYGQETELASASFALSLAEIGRWIADFGTDIWNVRAIAGARDARRETQLVAGAMLIKSVGSLVVGLVIVVMCRLELGSAGYPFGLIAALLLPTSQMASLTIAYFQAKDDIKQLAVMILPCAATLLAFFLTLLVTANPLLALGVMTAGEICVAAMLLAILRRRLLPMKLSASWPDAVSLARACVPAAAFGIVVGVYSRIDTLVLAKYSLAALAAYTIAQRLYQPFQIAVTSIAAITYRRVSHSIATMAPVRREFLTMDLPAILGGSILSAAILLWGGRVVLQSVFPQYAAALGPLKILCAVLPVLAFNSAIAGLLLGYGRFWIVLSISAADLILTYCLMTILVPLNSASGSAQSLLAGALFAGVALSVATGFMARAQNGHSVRIATP